MSSPSDCYNNGQCERSSTFANRQRITSSHATATECFQWPKPIRRSSSSTTAVPVADGSGFQWPQPVTPSWGCTAAALVSCPSCFHWPAPVFNLSKNSLGGYCAAQLEPFESQNDRANEKVTAAATGSSKLAAPSQLDGPPPAKAPNDSDHARIFCCTAQAST